MTFLFADQFHFDCLFLIETATSFLIKVTQLLMMTTPIQINLSPVLFNNVSFCNFSIIQSKQCPHVENCMFNRNIKYDCHWPVHKPSIVVLPGDVFPWLHHSVVRSGFHPVAGFRVPHDGAGESYIQTRKEILKNKSC